MVAKKSTPTPSAPEPVKPTFGELAMTLVSAESAVKAAKAYAGQARAVKSEAAVRTILAAFDGGLSDNKIRLTLITAGVLKGTVSKIVTIVYALRDGVMEPADLKSLNGAYNTVKEAEKIRNSAAVAAVTGTPYSAPVETPKAKVASPQEAIDYLVSVVKSVTDADERYKLGGEFIGKVTTAITAALSATEDDDEDENAEGA